MSSKIRSTVVALICISNLAQAQTLAPKPSADMEALFYQQIAEESGIEVNDVSTRGLMSGEVPNGLSYKDMSPSCDPRRFEDSVIGKKLSNRQYYAVAKKYFEKCGKELSSNASTGLLGLLKFALYQYPFLENPQIKEVKIKLGDGTILPGILALKKDPRPRPMVIVRCGVFCTATPGASMKSYMMHLFDQSPFNVLLIASQTGSDYITTNHKVTLGGWAEGYETLEAGKWMMEKWEHRDRISSLHLIGISLGGNTAVMGAAFNDKYLFNGRKIFNSSTGICPVVSLRPTLDKLYSDAIVGTVFSKLTKDQFRDTRAYIKDVPDLLAENKLPWTRFGMTEFIGNLASTALNRRGIASTPDSYFKSNNFWNWKEDVKTPLLLWASKDDIIVNNQINTAVVENSDQYEKSETVGTLNLPYGTHCAFSSAYGAQAAATVLRTFILNNSPEFIDSYDTKQELPWTFGFDKLGSTLEHVRQTWTFTANSKQVKVDFKIFMWNADRACTAAGPWKSAPEKCYITKTHWVPVASLKALGAHIPTTTTEAQALSREFNTKVEFRVKGSPLNGTNKTSFFMTWRNHFE